MPIARILIFILLLAPCSAFAAKVDTVAIPEQLLPWQDWVLYGFEEQLHCTPFSNNATQLQCDWPTELSMVLHDTGGTFSQEWLVQHERWVQLPGDQINWPDGVTINDSPALVISRNGFPQVKLKPGTYILTGNFRWTTIPEYLTVPPHSGLVSVEINDKKIHFPDLDANGRLWLQTKRTTKKKIENRLSIQSYRLINDRIPLKIETVLQLDVSGIPREILLGPVFSPEDVVPVALNSSLPARLENDGRVRIQVRQGQWNLTLTTRHIGPVSSLKFTQPDDGFWPSEEIWSFSSNPNLRVVEIENVPAIDPLQTSLPSQWHKFPAYRMITGNIMSIKEIKRGDPLPAPDQLHLNRQLWLRFDGSGYTLQDSITGTKTTNWRLEMNPKVKLGRVTVDGKEQFITKQNNTDKAGVELRKGLLNLTADSEYFEKISLLPATGWDHDFQEVSANLFLPPGWRLINASGMDNIRSTWVKRWTLLDFFIVLILTVAIARLFSKPVAVLAFATLVLIYHEPNAPRWIWLAILACVALLRYLPEGKFKKCIKFLQVVNIIILIILAIPFSIEQLRIGIFPQLEKPWKSMATPLPMAQPKKSLSVLQDDEGLVQGNIPAEQEIVGNVTEALEERAKSSRSIGKGYANRYDSSSGRKQVAQYDPSMVNQTGPGLPNWQWNSVPFSWSGPVQPDQKISLFLIGPKTNLVLSFVRVIFLILLTLGILNIRYPRGEGRKFPDIKSLFLLPLILVCLTSPSISQAGQIPSPEMLEELRTRLLKQDDCFPECADISQMKVHIDPENLNIQIRVATQTTLSIPLPGNARHWLPQEVTIDGKKADALFRTNDQLWLLVQSGSHEVVLKGKIPSQNILQLSLPLKPHFVESSAKGWTVEGIQENGRPDNQIQFRRIVKEESTSNQILETGVLPPFLIIERTLQLGLNWKMVTEIKRTGTTGSAVVFDYPLLPGESILTEGLRVKDNNAQVTLDPKQYFLKWESVLEKTDQITLKHSETDLWTEIWRVDVSPIFHMETSGIPVILHQQGKRWYPTWHPWPGEEVNLSISRPTGIEGQTITIDKVFLDNQPGRRTTSTKMTLSVRSSQGGQHTITLPDSAQLMEVRINGQVLPIRQKNNKVTLPVNPGKQEILIQWNEATGIGSFYRTPEVDLGLNSVNCNINVKLPQNRWPLFLGGPLMGPAVLFWSVILIIFLVSFALGKTGLTPLKFYQWFLLGIGMSQSNIIASLLVVGWLIALELRRRAKPDMEKTTFNLMQIGIAVLTIVAISSLVVAISQGLLGHPDMNIIGNGSSSSMLKWYQDHSNHIIPQAWVISIPMLIYRLAMLSWALWISFSLINLLKWGWNSYSEPVIWHKIPRKAKKKVKKKKDSEEQTPEPNE